MDEDTMILADRNLEALIRKTIRKASGSAPISPVDLVVELEKSKPDVSLDDVRATLWSMMAIGELEVSGDGTLEIASH